MKFGSCERKDVPISVDNSHICLGGFVFDWSTKLSIVATACNIAGEECKSNIEDELQNTFYELKAATRE